MREAGDDWLQIDAEKQKKLDKKEYVYVERGGSGEKVCEDEEIFVRTKTLLGSAKSHPGVQERVG
jgi:hypothetical protein